MYLTCASGVYRTGLESQGRVSGGTCTRTHWRLVVCEGLTERLSYLVEHWISAAAALGEIGNKAAIRHILETLPGKPYGARDAL